MKKRLIFSLLLMSCVALGQQKIDKQNPFFTIRGNIGIPRSTGSMMFRQSFSGIYEGNLAGVIRPADNFIVGLGYQNALFKNHKSFVLLQTPTGSLAYNTMLIEHGGFLKLGYDYFVSPTNYVNYSLNTGMLFCNYAGIEPDTSKANRPFGETKFAAPYVQPEISINFIVGDEQLLSFSLMLSYTTLFYTFDPKAPRFNHLSDPPIYIKGNRYFMNWINIGLGFNVLLRGKSRGTGS
jgi:hypothetical protein